MKITQHITESINSLPAGVPFTSSQFLMYGSRNSIDQSIVRLVKRGKITRITRGIYVKPKQSRFTGPVLLSPLEVAQFIAAKTGAVIQVHGAEAARHFGLTTQMPTQAVYLTNGPSRKLSIGRLQLTLKHVTSRKLVNANSKIGLAITALWYQGKQEVNEKTIAKIKSQLTEKEYREFVNSVNQMPIWLANIVQKYARLNQHG
jgi:hypothetical protein